MGKKVAILLRGHIRNYGVLDLCISNLKKFLVKQNPHYEFQFFLQTWSFLDWNHDNTPFQHVQTDCKTIEEIDKDIIVNIDHFDFYLPRIHSQYKIINNSNSSKKIFEQLTNTKFDIVLSTRPDLIVYSNINLDEINLETYTLTYDDKWFGDWFCISNNELMGYYCDLYQYIPQLEEEIRNKGVFNNYNPDPHALLVLHLLKNGFCFSLENMIELGMSSSLPDLPVVKNIEHYFIDYCLKRVDGREDMIVRKIK